MHERTALYNLCHSHRGRERWQRCVWWRNGRWLAECTTCSKKSEVSGREWKTRAVCCSPHSATHTSTSRASTAYSTWN
jgi:hypothetical protein